MENTDNVIALPAEENSTTPAPTTRKPRTPKPLVRNYVDLLEISPKKMTDEEKNMLIETLLDKTKFLENKAQELDTSYTRLHKINKEQGENFQKFVAEHNAQIQYVNDTLRLAYQSVKLLQVGGN